MKKTKPARRGRPKGSKNKPKNIVVAPVVEQVPVKRGRGRPRKNPIVPTDASGDVPFKTFAEAIEGIVKKRRGRPSGKKSVDGTPSEESSIFKRVQMPSHDPKWIWKYWVFEGVPLQYHIIRDLVARGVRVLVAEHPDFWKIYFKKYHEPGEDGFPHGGITVYNANNRRSESYYLESVALHPKGGSIRMIELIDSDGNETGIIPDGNVPTTKREERIARQLALRQKKLDKEAAKQAKRDARQAKKDAKLEKRRLRLEKRAAKEAKKVERAARKAAKLAKLEKQKKKSKKFID